MDKQHVVCMYNGLQLSHKKEWNNAIGSNMDGPRDYPIKQASKRKANISLTCGIWNMIHMNLLKKKKRLTDIESKPMVTKRERG